MTSTSGYLELLAGTSDHDDAFLADALALALTFIECMQHSSLP